MQNRHVFAYGLLGLPLAFAALPVYVHVPNHYAAAAGMELGLLGSILLGVRLLDAIVDPWLGWQADRMPRRRLLALALLPLAVGFWALLNPPARHAPFWLCASLALTCLGFSAATIAHQAWSADIGANSAARTRLSAAREGFGMLGILLAAILPSLLASDPVDGVARLGWIMPGLLLLCAIMTFFLVPNLSPGSPVPDDAPLFAAARSGAGTAAPRTLAAGLRLIWREQAFIRLLLVFIVNGIAAALPATLFFFFVGDVLQSTRAGGPLLALYFLAGAVSLPFWTWLSAKYGRVPAWLAAMVLSIVAFGGAALLGAGDLVVFALICLVSGIAVGADLALPAAIAADLGARRGIAGACFGVWNFAAKLNLALAAGLALPALGMFGYVPGSGNGVAALVFTYALVPLGFKALALVLLWRWRHCLEIQS